MVENNTGNRGYLSDSVDEDGLYPIYGVAIGNNDITIGNKSGEPKLWRPQVLEASANTLEGKDIVVNHENQDAYLKIGVIEEAKYDEETGVVYRGVIDDDELAEKINRDWLEVSPRIKHSKSHEMVQGVKIPDAIHDFDNLSVVRRGAAGSNEVHLGEIEELSVEELQSAFDSGSDEVIEYQNISDADTIEELQGEIDYSRWMYEDRDGAEGAGPKFGCEGTHVHEVDGRKWFMPCETHEKFLKGMKEVESEENSENEELENEIEDGVDKENEAEEELMEYDQYSGEEKQIASQMASYSEMTKSECLSLVDAFNPAKDTDYQSLAKMLYKITGDDEMERLYSEMDKQYKKKEYSRNESGKSSPLNRIFG